MRLSIIICTYQRVESVGRLLQCLGEQTARGFEVLLVDGSGKGSDAHRRLGDMVMACEANFSIRLLPAQKGLTRQRNAGLAAALGELILFLDDDVTFSPGFVKQIMALMDRPDWQDVGGVTGFDTRNHGQRFGLRWRLRSAMGVAPALTPGTVDRWGRSIPVGFMEPFSGHREVGYLPGHCMLYRRTAIGDLRFDEALPTYGGEDRDFSWRLGRRWRLVMSGDWLLEHHCAPESRDSGVQRTYQAGFGLGRSFRQNMSRAFDYFQLLRLVICEFVFDGLVCLWRPTREKWMMPMARFKGFLAGVRSAPGRPA